MINTFIKSFIGFVRKNYKFIDKWSALFFNILMTINFITLVYALWSINTNEYMNTSSSFILLGIQLFITIFIIITIIYNWSQKDEQSKLNKNIFIIVIFIIIFSIPITYLILYIGRTLSTKEGVQIGSADGWLSFIGSIIGGIITMIAVVYTIQHEKIVDSLKSIPNFGIKLTDENSAVMAKVIDPSNIMLNTILRVDLTNISIHNALYFKLTKIEFSSAFENENKFIRNKKLDDLVISKVHENIYYSNETRIIPIPIDVNIAKDIYYKLILEFEFYDYLKIKKYTYMSIGFIEITTDEQNLNKISSFIGKRMKFDIKLVNNTHKFTNV